MIQKNKIQRIISILRLLPIYIFASGTLNASFPLPESYIFYAEEDTVIAPDTLTEPIKIYVIPHLGSISDPELPSLSYLQLLFLEYKSAGDRVDYFPGIYHRDKGAPGQPGELSAFGLDWKTIGVMIDGRYANDPLIGVYDFHLFPPEFIESIEYLPFWRSFLYQRNAVGAGFNIRTQNYTAPTPYTRLRYSEGPNNYSQTDVMLSQDIAPGVNATIGLHRQFFGRSDVQNQFRGRFPNMNFRSLNYRTKIRWNVSRQLNIMFSTNHMNNFTGLSGGIDIIATPLDELFSDLEAMVRNTDAFQRVRRHDYTLTGGLQLLPDSLDTGSISLYHSRHVRQYRDEDDRPNPNDIFLRTDHISTITGIDVKQWFTVGALRMHAGGNYQELAVEESENTGAQNQREFGGFVRVQFQPLPYLETNVMMREDVLRNSNYTSFGFDGILRYPDVFEFQAGAVRTFRHPTIQELYWQDTTIVRPSILFPETHNIVFAELAIHPHRSISLTLGSSYRIIDDPIFYTPGEPSRIFPDITIRQGSQSNIFTSFLDAAFRIGNISVEGRVTHSLIEENGVQLQDLPEFDVRGRIIYRDLLFNGNLDLQIMLETEYFTRHFGREFNPETYFTTPQTLAIIGAAGALHGSVVGKIGNAHVHITYTNAVGTNYFRAPFYPMPESYMRFGLTWEFLN